MIAKYLKLLTIMIMSTAILMLSAAVNTYAAAPVKLVLANHIGWKVDKTSGGNLCTLASKDECQLGVASSEPGGFEYPESVAGAPNGDIYIADRGNDRIQKLTANGEFLLMFGEKVDKSTGANICTEASGDTCGAGEPGSSSEAFSEEVQNVTVDPSTEHVYVYDFVNSRIAEYSSTGQFILMIGKEVNETKVTEGGSEAEKNLCTLASKDVCKIGVRSAPGSLEHGAFRLTQFAGDLLAVGGAPEHLLYVGDEARIQEFSESGEWKGEIGMPLTVGKPITSIAVDDTTETVYAVAHSGSAVHVFNTKGEEVKDLDVLPREEGELLQILSLAIDSSDHLAVWAAEGEGTSREQAGFLYQAASGQLLTKFTTGTEEGAVGGIGFNGVDELYAALNQEVLVYFPEPVAELTTLPASCVSGADQETNVTFDCNLNGSVDAWGVTETEAWFEWGRTPALGQETEPQQIANVKNPPVEGEEEPLVQVSAIVKGIRPNESGFYYRLASRDHNVHPPELLNGFPTISFTTPTVSPKIVGEPAALFVKPSSAVLFSELNPENTRTEYFFEYGACEELASCAQKTSTLQSATYGKIGVTLEAKGLQPATTYHYRMVAVNEKNQAAVTTPADEGTFTTSVATKVQAETGQASLVGATSAIVTGTVNPDGQVGVYTFELGLYNGAGTQYGVVFSGPTDASTVPVAESLQITGLQPATTYAYRITIHYGQNTTPGSVAVGSSRVFTTQGVPEILVFPIPQSMLATPTNIKFPPPVKLPKKSPQSCKHGYKLDKHHKCVKTRKNKSRGSKVQTKRK